MPLVVGQNPAEEPLRPKVFLLTTIATTFVFGAMVGAHAVVRWHHAAMLLPAGAVTLFAGYVITSTAFPMTR